jgi:Holliday junction resolvase RusA-like endonuclease
MIELHIPVEIPSQNSTGQGRTWQARAANTKRTRNLWRTWTMVEMRRAGVVRADGPRSLHIIAYRTQRCADIANLIGGAKACIDGMTDAGLLVDDRDSLARITYEQQVASKSPTKKPHTALVIEDIKETA